MSETTILTVILAIGLAIGVAVPILIRSIQHNLVKIKAILDNNKLFAKKTAEMEEMKVRGELHEWVKVQTAGGQMLVCKKTGWCPDLQGFVSLELVEEYFTKIKAQEEYKEYRDLRVAELAKELDFDIQKMEDVVERIFSIKKDFHLNKAIKLTNELTQRAEDVRKQDIL